MKRQKSERRPVIGQRLVELARFSVQLAAVVKIKGTARPEFDRSGEIVECVAVSLKLKLEITAKHIRVIFGRVQSDGPVEFCERFGIIPFAGRPQSEIGVGARIGGVFCEDVVPKWGLVWPSQVSRERGAHKRT